MVDGFRARGDSLEGNHEPAIGLDDEALGKVGFSAVLKGGPVVIVWVRLGDETPGGIDRHTAVSEAGIGGAIGIQARDERAARVAVRDAA